jgi:hypothetical protein
VEGGGDRLVGDDDLAPLRLLQAQFFVDELVGDLGLETGENFGGGGKTGGQREQTGAVFDIASGDHVTADYRHDPHPGQRCSDHRCSGGR